MTQGRLAISTELSAANSHCTFGAPTRVDRQYIVAALAQMEQDRTALEDREIPVGQPRHLTERLMREMLGAPSTKRHALDAVGNPASSSAQRTRMSSRT